MGDIYINDEIPLLVLSFYLFRYIESFMSNNHIGSRFKIYIIIL